MLKILFVIHLHVTSLPLCGTVQYFVYLHSCDMKTHYIKFEILNERLSLFYCNIIHLSLALNMFMFNQICNANYHPFGDGRDAVTRSLYVCNR